MLHASADELKRKPPSRPLAGTKVWVPRLNDGASRAFAAALRSVGVDAECMPPSNARTVELGGQFTCGDECCPLKVTLGDFLREIEKPGTDPKKTALLMASSDGPCRLGQYIPYIRGVLDSMGHHETQIITLTTADSYANFGELAGNVRRATWRAVVAADILLKLLLQTRPYEIDRGSADECFELALRDLCQTIERPYGSPRAQLEAMKGSVLRARDRFRNVPAQYEPDRPLIGIVGEAYCRLNTFTNDDLVRRLEQHGAEAWMSDMAEWVWYIDYLFNFYLHLRGQTFSGASLGARIRAMFQSRDEHELVALCREDFRGYEEAEDMRSLLRGAESFLPFRGSDGEMILNVSKCAYFAKKGVDGILDISPFTCMNGVVSEAIYPAMSRSLNGIPIRIFYFDTTTSDVERDLGIFVELARSYGARKTNRRVYPARFSSIPA